MRSIVNALRFTGAEPLDLAPEAWPRALDFADRHHLTLLLSRVALPEITRKHVDGALARNRRRVENVQTAYRAFKDAGIEHVVLKGFTHVPDFIGDPALRAQYDLDVYVPPPGHLAAFEALRGLGYEPVGGWKDVDHLPTLVRKTGWEFRGDYFDPEMPVSFEVHFRWWDEDSLRLRPEGLDAFWTRRRASRLDPVDALGYAALHLLRHVLHGNARAFHIWEIANFLHSHHEHSFWERWRELHPASLRRLEAIAFGLARQWFACDVPELAQGEIRALPGRAQRWIEQDAFSPIEAESHPHKRELWLHLAMCETAGDRARILRRRLLPASLPGAIDAIYLPEERMTLKRRLKKQARYAAFTMSRAAYHARVLIPTLWEGIRS